MHSYLLKWVVAQSVYMTLVVMLTLAITANNFDVTEYVSIVVIMVWHSVFLALGLRGLCKRCKGKCSQN